MNLEDRLTTNTELTAISLGAILTILERMQGEIVQLQEAVAALVTNE